MIPADQPRCFPGNVLVALSSKSDGTILDKAVGVHHATIATNRSRFCASVGVEYGDVVFQRIVYGNDRSYDTIVDVGASDTAKHKSEVVADALFTDESGVGLLLPVADCVATVIYDPKHKYLALLHLGRHSSLTQLIQKTVDHFCEKGSQPQNLMVWMSPSVHQSHYRMDYFTAAGSDEWKAFCEKRSDGYYIDLQGHNKQAFVVAGVLAGNIHVSPHNTATHSEYFSHSQGDTNGRFAVLAMICD